MLERTVTEVLVQTDIGAKEGAPRPKRFFLSVEWGCFGDELSFSITATDCSTAWAADVTESTVQEFARQARLEDSEYFAKMQDAFRGLQQKASEFSATKDERGSRIKFEWKEVQDQVKLLLSEIYMEEEEDSRAAIFKIAKQLMDRRRELENDFESRRQTVEALTLQNEELAQELAVFQEERTRDRVVKNDIFVANLNKKKGTIRKLYSGCDFDYDREGAVTRLQRRSSEQLPDPDLDDDGLDALGVPGYQTAGFQDAPSGEPSSAWSSAAQLPSPSPSPSSRKEKSPRKRTARAADLYDDLDDI